MAKTSWIYLRRRRAGEEEYSERTIARKIWASLHDLVAAASSRQLSSSAKDAHRLKWKEKATTGHAQAKDNHDLNDLCI